MRFRITLSYMGTHYAGWQRQPGDKTVQQTLEDAFSTILRQGIELTGCGRTDTGVHARHYVAHADIQFPESHGDSFSKLLYRINSILPFDIAVHRFEKAEPEFHARFDAKARTYRYYVHFEKDPFKQFTSCYFPHARELNEEVLHQAAALLLEYNQFKPFCKTGSDAEHYMCDLMESKWTMQNDSAFYTVRANRFLRGMVRLMVGAGLNVALGKISMEQLKACMDNQTPLPQAWSVPAEGLFLEEIEY